MRFILEGVRKYSGELRMDLTGSPDYRASHPFHDDISTRVA